MMRRVFAPYGYHDVYRTGLREVVAARAALASLERELVVGARLRGYGWTVIADDLQLSPQGARKRHLDADPIYARRLEREPTLAEVLAAFGASKTG